MHRRAFLKNLALAGTSVPLLSSCQFVQSHHSGRRRPNVILVLTDDQGYSDVGFHGNPHLRTPNLDKFAAQSVEFEQFYAQPVCSPTRACLMTGRYHYRTGVIDTGEARSLLADDEVTLAEALQQAGYKTAIYGKWHLGDNCPARPMDQGFDESLVHLGGMIGAPYNPLDGNAYFDPMLICNGQEKRYQGYCGDIWTNEAIEFIDRHASKPFFMYYATNVPHHPLTVPEEDTALYKRMGLSVDTARYYGMLSNFDRNFGRLLAALDRHDLTDDTIIIFMGDNGTSSLHKQDDLYEYGLRGRKTYVYENGIRVPCCIRYPAGFAGGRKTDTIASCIDIMPTVLQACGVSTKQSIAFDGCDLIPLLTQASQNWPDRNLYFQWHRGDAPEKYRNMAVRNQRFKLVQPVGRGIEEFTEPRFELYDIVQDPFEQNDIAAQHPDVVQQLKADYEAWFEDVCSERGFLPQPIHVGTERENPVFLTRQDIRDASTFGHDSGHYRIDIKKSGYYRVTCRLTDMLKEAHPVTMKVGDLTFKKEILYAESQCRFDRVSLPAGVTTLQAWVEIDGEKHGFRFIEIEKL